MDFKILFIDLQILNQNICNMGNFIKPYKVIDLYLRMADYNINYSREDMCMCYNTLNSVRQGIRSLKIDHITRIANGLLGEENEYMIRCRPDEFRRHLTMEEFYARIFAAMLNDDAELIGRVANMLQGLADGRLPTAGELAAQLLKTPKKKL